LEPDWIERLRNDLPELPDHKMRRLMQQYSLSVQDALLLTATPAQADYFEEVAQKSGNPRSSANWIMGELAYALKNSGKEIVDSPVPAQSLAALVRTIDSGEISGKIAKTVFEEMCRTAEEPASIAKRMGLVQLSDEASIIATIDKILAANPKQLAEYRAGKTKVFGFFVGQVMKETKGQANPQVVNDLLQRKLERA
jgi:aspartyl-tRNA(Asn)/glutamyl-tRNA(Gln) amidotransferase subunit B